MTYESIDPIIDGWSREHSLRIVPEFGGVPRRFCYVSGGIDESFQISIEPPAGEAVVVKAWSVETRDDQEFHEQWTASAATLRSTLEEALATISKWKERDA